MRATPTWEDVRERAREQAWQHVLGSGAPPTMMHAMLFAPYDLNVVREEILTQIGLWDAQSRTDIDFLWPGYSVTDPDRLDSVPVELPPGTLPLHIPRFFSRGAFVRFCDDLKQAYPGWSYENGVEMVLFDAEYVASVDDVLLNPDRFVTLRLDAALNVVGSGQTVNKLIGTMFDYAKENERGTSVTEFMQIWRPDSNLWQRLRALLHDHGMDIASLGLGVFSIFGT
jgi:hypothetical protein